MGCVRLATDKLFINMAMPCILYLTPSVAVCSAVMAAISSYRAGVGIDRQRSKQECNNTQSDHNDAFCLCIEIKH